MAYELGQGKWVGIKLGTGGRLTLSVSTIISKRQHLLKGAALSIFLQNAVLLLLLHHLLTAHYLLIINNFQQV